MIEDVSHLTGMEGKSTLKSIILNEVRFNGVDGKFKYVNLIDRKDRESAEETDLGESIQAVFLRVRRRLGGYKTTTDQYITSTEHNDQDDTVLLYATKERDVAKVLYEKHAPYLRAQRIVYAYLLREGLSKELVRIVVKGKGLMSDKENPELYTGLLNYLQRDKGVDHVYQFVTKLRAVKMKGQVGHYFTIDFTAGPKLPDEKMLEVIEKIKELAKNATEQDNYYRSKDAVPPTVEIPVIEYPTEDLDINEIPF